MLSIVEVFSTLQGEGSLTGTPAVFVRLSACNLWSGLSHLRDRGAGVCADWCDTEFHTGAPHSVADVVAKVQALTEGWSRPTVVLTGGEPLLQLRRPVGIELVATLRALGVRVCLETNGTQAIPEGLVFDHVTVSPKALKATGGSADHLVQRAGTDFKIVVPSPFTDETLVMLAEGFAHRYVQPMDEDGTGKTNVGLAIETAQRLGWSVSVQTHKLIGLP